MTKKTIEDVKANAKALANSCPEMPVVRRAKPLPVNATQEDVKALLNWLEASEGHRMSDTARLAIDSMLTRLNA